jgi:WYL_2, Sm-like SH3 beta-barrel fold
MSTHSKLRDRLLGNSETAETAETAETVEHKKTGEPTVIEALALKVRADECREMLRGGVWMAEFVKADGTETVMECTLDPALLPETPSSSATNRTPKAHLVYAYSIDRQGWRALMLGA